MKRGSLLGLALVTGLVAGVACSGSSKNAKTLDDTENVGGQGSVRADKDLTDDDVEQKSVPPKASDDSGEPKSASDSPKDNPEPAFKEGGSVDEAINAVPQGLPRENVELEELNKPLNDPAVYDSCKLTPSSHFEIKFAVWGGRCVGMDIKTTPKNPKLEGCLREVVSNAKWRDKTKSLNISTVSF
jgi:hypothetical protein